MNQSSDVTTASVPQVYTAAHDKLTSSMSGDSKAAAQSPPTASDKKKPATEHLHFVPYGEEKESPFLPAIKQLISKDLSEPYSIYVYRYFLYARGFAALIYGTY